MKLGLGTMLTKHRADIDDRTAGISFARTLNESLILIACQAKHIPTFNFVMRFACLCTKGKGYSLCGDEKPG
jgi:hypothetical protein